MEESEARVQMSIYLHTPADGVARRMLECPESYRRWEVEIRKPNGDTQRMRAIFGHH